VLETVSISLGRFMEMKYQLNDECANEAHHAGPGIPYLGSLGEPQKGLTQLWLHPGYLNLNRYRNSVI
jgi:hypothetical protein